MGEALNEAQYIPDRADKLPIRHNRILAYIIVPLVMYVSSARTSMVWVTGWPGFGIINMVPSDILLPWRIPGFDEALLSHRVNRVSNVRDE